MFFYGQFHHSELALTGLIKLIFLPKWTHFNSLIRIGFEVLTQSVKWCLWWERERERERFWFVSKLMDMAMDFWETCVIQWLFFDSQFKTWCSQHVTSHHTVVRLICSFTLQWNNWKQGDTIFWQIEWNCNASYVFVFVWMFFMFVHFHFVTFEFFYEWSSTWH